MALGIRPLVSIHAALLLSFTEGSVGKRWLLELVARVFSESPAPSLVLTLLGKTLEMVSEVPWGPAR